MASILDRWKRGVNAFQTEEAKQVDEPLPDLGSYSTVTSIRPDRVQTNISNEKSIITSIYNRIAIDVASIDIRHVRLDDQGRYLTDIPSGLNNCLTVEANLDQAARHFRQDFVMSLLDQGVAALVPIDTDVRIEDGVAIDIQTMRVGEIVKWFPDKVRLKVYNERTGIRQEITLPKTKISIVENPFYSVMNKPNSTLQRLIRKLNLLDAIDEASASGKLDLIIQLPYVIKSEARRQQAQQRREEIEVQLKGSKYGIAYTDGTEKITQLNRPVENNLMAQITFLRTTLFGELGITEDVMNGNADEATMLKYWNSTVEPILEAMVESMRRNFLTKTARSQRQSLLYFRDPFKLLPIKDIADIADKLARNEVLSSNEIRGKLGFRPSSDPKADQLVNSNMPTSDTGVAVPGDSPDAPASPDASAEAAPTDSTAPASDTTSVMASSFDDIDKAIDAAFADLGLDANDDA